MFEFEDIILVTFYRAQVALYQKSLEIQNERSHSLSDVKIFVVDFMPKKADDVCHI